MHSIRTTYRLIALIMAILMFVATVGVSIDMHYCKGQLKSFSLIGKAKNCHEMAASCSKHSKMMKQQANTCSEKEKGCCSSKTVHIQLQQDQQIQNSDFVVSEELQQFMAAFVAVFLQNVQIDAAPSPFAHYKPPLIQRDILVLTESFLL